MKLFLQTLFLIALASVIVLAAGIIPMPSFLAAMMPDGANKKAPQQQLVIAQPVTVMRARTRAFTQTVRLTGSIVAREEYLVLPEVSGLRIISITASEGEHVAKGQVLATLVDTQLKTLLAQNDAAMAKAEAAIAQARSQITQAQASHNEAKASFKRAVMLRNKGHISVSVLDTQKAAAQTAKARLISARDGLQLAKADIRQVKALRREIDWKLSNTNIKAPGAGIISRKTAKLGALASGLAEPLFRIIAKGEIEMEADVPETELPQLKTGQRAQITAPGVAAVSGTVRLIYPEIDKSSRLGKLRIFIGANAALRIGTFARAIVETTKGNGVGVPLSSILFNDDGAAVQVVKNKRIISRVVKTGLRENGVIEITSGIDNGDLVVVRAGTFLRDGDQVTPVLEPPQNTNAALHKKTLNKQREAMR